MTDSRRRWARILSGASIVLLLVAAFSLWQVMDDYIDTYDPESSYLVKLGPGGSETFEIKSSQISCLRVSDGESVESDLILVDESGSEIIGRSPTIFDPDRFSPDQSITYSTVRVFTDVSGTYTLENRGGSTLWLVDDEAAANKMDTPLILVFYMGCCVGLPMSVIALVLAIMNWIDKRKSPDQFFVTEEGSVIVTRSGEVVQLESELSESTEPDLTIESEQKFQTESDGKNESPQAEPEDWEWWDEG